MIGFSFSFPQNGVCLPQWCSVMLIKWPPFELLTPHHYVGTPVHHASRPYLDYVAYLYQKMDPLPEQERFEVPTISVIYFVFSSMYPAKYT